MMSTTAKVWEWNGVVFGGCGSWRAIQVLQYWLDNESVSHQLSRFENDLERFMVKHLMPEIKTIFDRHGPGQSEDDSGSAFLIGSRGKLYYLGEEYEFIELEDPFGAIGSGDQLALGALSVLAQDETLEPEEILVKSLESAERYTSYVRRPFRIVTTKKTTRKTRKKK